MTHRAQAKAFWQQTLHGLSVRFYGDDDDLPVRWYPGFALVRVPGIGVVSIEPTYDSYVVSPDRELVGSVYRGLRITITEHWVGKLTEDHFEFDDIACGKASHEHLRVFVPEGESDPPCWQIIQRKPMTGGYEVVRFRGCTVDLSGTLRSMERYIATWLGEPGEFTRARGPRP